MSWIAKCDGCGKELGAPTNRSGEPYNPYDEAKRGQWFSRVNDDGKLLHSCSRDCIEKLGGLVLPV